MGKYRRRSTADDLSIKVASAFGFLADLPFRTRRWGVARPETLEHARWQQFLSDSYDKPGVRVLDGSRNVTTTNLRSAFSHAEYVGFDFYPGENVDVVGDAHRLSSYFETEDKFDLIFSSATFEHLYMPWVVALEIQKMLKVGGVVFVETHFSFSYHEAPWNFFQFSANGLRALFSDALGFELLESGHSNPIVGYFGHGADKAYRYRPVTDLYCHSEILCRKIRELDAGFDWRSIPMESVVATSLPSGGAPNRRRQLTAPGLLLHLAGR